ncbi:MAG TPA: hypothetical protein VGF46_07245 [Gaiellales bacterium]|jgi:hypothetical protein
MRRERGQAGIEAIIALPLVVLVALACAEGGAWAASSVLAAQAADAGARALARGAPGEPAARAQLPGAFRRRARIDLVDGAVRVVVRVPGLVPGMPVLDVSARSHP